MLIPFNEQDLNAGHDGPEHPQHSQELDDSVAVQLHHVFLKYVGDCVAYTTPQHQQVAEQWRSGEVPIESEAFMNTVKQKLTYGNKTTAHTHTYAHTYICI